MSKKRIPLLTVLPVLLLAGCVNNQPDPYVYPEEYTEVSFDYSNNLELKNSLAQIHFENDGDVDVATLDRVLSIVAINDMYANRLTYAKSNTIGYIDNAGNKVAGDLVYSIQQEITRNNDRNSLSGTVSISDEKWTANEVDPTLVDHYRKSTTGTYSLVPDTVKELGDEIIDCEDNAYDSKKTIGYSTTIWGNKMNLTQASDIALKFNEVLEKTDERNQSVPDAYKFKTTLKSRKDSDSLTITLQSKASQPTSADNGHTFEETYIVSITFLNGMISNTRYQYTQLEKSEDNDYIVVAELETRVLSHSNN